MMLECCLPGWSELQELSFSLVEGFDEDFRLE
jgi:hypothetical protein